MSPLRKKMIDIMTLKRYSPKTQKHYLKWVIELSQYFNKSPDKLSNEQIQKFLLYLQNERLLSWSSCNQAAWSICFFFEMF